MLNKVSIDTRTSTTGIAKSLSVVNLKSFQVFDHNRYVQLFAPCTSCDFEVRGTIGHYPDGVNGCTKGFFEFFVVY